MKINNNTKQPKYRKTKFGTLNAGDVFVDNYNYDVFMKLYEDVSIRGVNYNAVNLAKGTVVGFRSDNDVFLTYATLEYNLLVEL